MQKPQRQGRESVVKERKKQTPTRRATMTRTERLTQALVATGMLMSQARTARATKVKY